MSSVEAGSEQSPIGDPLDTAWHPGDAVIDRLSAAAAPDTIAIVGSAAGEVPTVQPPIQKAPHNRSTTWIVTSAVLMIVAIAVGALWYNDNAQLSARVTNLSSELMATNSNLASTNSELASTQSSLAAARLEAANPTVTTWNSCGGSCDIGPMAWRAGGVPDTFTYHLAFTSNVEVTYGFIELQQYVKFATCDRSQFYMLKPAISKTVGCLARSGVVLRPPYYGGGRAQNVDFHQGEGCASWIMVMFPTYANQTARVHPNVSVTYRPASKPTC